MKLQIVIQSTDGNRNHAEMEVAGDSCLIGRQGAHINLTGDRHCSRNHALLYVDSQGGLRIKDLQSRNGTFLSGGRITDSPVWRDTEIRVGRSRLVVLGFQTGAVPEGGSYSIPADWIERPEYDKN